MSGRRGVLSPLLLLGLSTSTFVIGRSHAEVTRRGLGLKSQNIIPGFVSSAIGGVDKKVPILRPLRGGHNQNLHDTPGLVNLAGVNEMSRNDNFTTSVEEQKDAAALKQKMAQAAQQQDEEGSLDDFPAVDISPQGTFKYVLIQAEDKKGGKKYLVRGSTAYDYHVYCARPTVDALKEKGFTAEVLGGGRMAHKPTQQRLDIYGRSHSFGREDKSITATVCQTLFPSYYITTSNEGY
mmetsp:Transcript_21789/g.44168  ORF Transcript_21789/g.44168 Transcript_21789/m.44168 type:complete len:237 (-) Transcript_21789:340-1050(-)|eukprot:CAMPEP_0181315874 /NCGR_PEP_ID=MMETSP1101-20121128/15601_1 /TAXON_ID=46948 /ORGANISM="Rhodomonas abbreviata, Strain Caron Lab Isolate" /LENGTH=236 /DNA_ID=CAMNT_0023423097 /DNA_START=172 /DNA_END=882 /DNA_ORIENTATION=+